MIPSIPLSRFHPQRGRTPLVLLALLLLAYLATRLAGLGRLPMVSDEGTYITWGLRALHATSTQDWLASVEDGKQPLLAWLMPPFLAALPDRLVAGRLVSVLTGAANLGLLILLGRRLFSPTVGWLAGVLYVVVPIALIHDRMALYDSLVATTALLALLATVVWADRPTWWRTLGLGLAMGLALLTKLSALFFVALVPLAISAWRPDALRQWWRLIQAYFVAGAMYSVLYLSPIVNNIEDGNFQRYSLTAGEILRLPWPIWLSNARFIIETAGAYLGPFGAWLCCIGAALAVAEGGRAGRVAVLWAGLPLLAFVFTAKIIYSRYVVFCFVAALLPAAWLLAVGAQHAAAWWRQRGGPRAQVVQWLLLAPVLALVAVPGVIFAYQLATNPAVAPWMNDPRYITDRFQYIESNYAGYGLLPIVEQVRAEAAQHPVVVMTKATTGMPRDGVTAYLLDWPNVFVGFVPEKDPVGQFLTMQPTRGYQLASTGAPVYYILSDAPNGQQERAFEALNPQAQLVQAIVKPGDHSRFLLYRVPWMPPPGDVWLTMPVRFGQHMQLAGYRIWAGDDPATATAAAATTLRPGQTLHVTLYWETDGPVGSDYHVFTHLNDAAGERRAQHDSQPNQNASPTSSWKAGDLIADPHDLTTKADLPPGEYELSLGLYDFTSGARLPVSGPGAASENRLLLPPIVVTP